MVDVADPVNALIIKGDAEGQNTLDSNELINSMTGLKTDLGQVQESTPSDEVDNDE